MNFKNRKAAKSYKKGKYLVYQVHDDEDDNLSRYDILKKDSLIFENNTFQELEEKFYYKYLEDSIFRRKKFKTLEEDNKSVLYKLITPESIKLTINIIVIILYIFYSYNFYY